MRFGRPFRAVSLCVPLPGPKPWAVLCPPFGRLEQARENVQTPEGCRDCRPGASLWNNVAQLLRTLQNRLAAWLSADPPIRRPADTSPPAVRLFFFFAEEKNGTAQRPSSHMNDSKFYLIKALSSAHK